RKGPPSTVTTSASSGSRATPSRSAVLRAVYESSLFTRFDMAHTVRRSRRSRLERAAELVADLAERGLRLFGQLVLVDLREAHELAHQRVSGARFEHRLQDR